jgi:hypothetical protein
MVQPTDAALGAPPSTLLGTNGWGLLTLKRWPKSGRASAAADCRAAPRARPYWTLVSVVREAGATVALEAMVFAGARAAMRIAGSPFIPGKRGHMP